MGFSSPIDKQYENLSRLRRQLLSSQALNDIKLEISQKNISEISKKIEQGKNELKQFCHTLTKDEMQLKAKELMELEKDIEMEKKNHGTLFEYNSLLKTNISKIENNLNELKMIKDMNGINKEMKKMELINTSATLAEHVNIILNQKKKEEKIIDELKNIEQINNGSSKTPDEYLKEILGNTKIEENGGFY